MFKAQDCSVEVGQLSVIDSWSATANNDYISSNGSRMGSGWSPLTTTRNCTMVIGGQLKLPLATEAKCGSSKEMARHENI